MAPIPWRVPRVEQMLTGQRITPAVAAKAGELVIEGAMPLANNGYTLPLTRTVVQRTLAALAAPA